MLIFVLLNVPSNFCTLGSDPKVDPLSICTAMLPYSKNMFKSNLKRMASNLYN